MQQLTREGHRKRMRAAYIKTGIDSMADHNVLELLLSLIIPQKDVKPLSYDLINHFGSLENVMDASINELMSIKGVGESTAVAISLVRNINRRIDENKNIEIVKLDTSDKAVEYCKNLLCHENVEKLVIITLKNDGTIINHHIITDKSVNNININMRSFISPIIDDNAAGVIISHNHPGGESSASEADVNFTVNINSLLKRFGVNLIDHIIIGNDGHYCLRTNLGFLFRCEK